MPYRQITLEERYHLASLRALRATPSEIARALGRHPSTIRRELTRNRTVGGPYRPYPAECYARTRRRQSRRNRRLTPASWQQVVQGLRLACSPEQIAGRGRRLGTLQISHETICRCLWYDRQAGGELYRLLRGSQKQRRRRVGSARRRWRTAASSGTGRSIPRPAPGLGAVY